MSRGRRFFVATCFLLFLAGVVEVASRLGLAVFQERTGGFAVLQLGKQRIAAGEMEVAPGSAEVARRLTEGISLHPFLGFVQTPRPVGREWLELHHLPINDFGFIDDKPSLQTRSTGRRIVAITGGSVAFFFGSEGQEELRRRLAVLPDFADREIVFVRLALGGFKQPQQLATVAYLLALGGEFDYVINLDGFNEVALHPVEGRPIGANFSYPRSWPRLAEAMATPSHLRALGAQAFWSNGRKRWAGVLSGPLLDQSGLAALVWKAGDRWLLGRVEAARAAFLDLAEGEHLGFSALGPRVGSTNETEMLSELAALWERSSLQLARLCRENDIQYLHFLQPNQYLPGSKPLGAAEHSLAIDPNSLYSASIAAAYPMLRKAGQRLAGKGVHFTDLTQLFARVDEAMYRDSCCHLNFEGNRRLAEAIAAQIAMGRAPDVSSQGTATSHPE